MIDREKVIKALECRKNADKRCGNPCEETGLCHYATAVRGLDGEIYKPFICDRESICADAIALLKEQEAVEPYMDYDGHDVWRCGNCGATIFHIEHSQADEDWKSYAKFCRQCGKKVKWK